jgi:hypothetical protein
MHLKCICRLEKMCSSAETWLVKKVLGERDVGGGMGMFYTPAKFRMLP